MVSSVQPEDFAADDLKKKKSKSPGLKDVKRAKSESVPVNDYLTQQADYLDDNETPEEIAKLYKKYKNSPKFNLNSEEVFCICRKPDHGGMLMISCDGCEEWFHFKCMKLDEKYQDLISKFYCKFCRWRQIGTTKWKRKCRLPSCHQPIRSDISSKYCSNEHGIEYLKSQLLDRTRTKVVGDLQSEEIKSILTFTNGKYDNLITLGQTFPEIPEVVELKASKTKDYSKFPLKLTSQLSQKDTNVERIENRLQLCHLKSRYLLKIKDKIKILNDKLNSGDSSADEEGPKLKKSKTKKYDLCCFDKTLSRSIGDINKSDYEALINSTNIYEDFKQEFDDIIRFYKSDNEIDLNKLYENKLCLQDRRKCPKHNGWWNLINDELFKYTAELSSTLELLENEKSILLRDYTISIYEGSDGGVPNSEQGTNA